MAFQTVFKRYELGYRYRERLHLYGGVTATVKMPISLSAPVIVPGDNSPTVSTVDSVTQELDENGVFWG